MYTHHEEGSEDLYVCDICEAIFVCENGIVDHLRGSHKEELLVMDVDQVKDATKSIQKKRNITENGDDDEGKEAKKPKLDLTFVEKQFYICEKCDDIFLEKKHLNIHIRNNHQEESTVSRPEASSTPKPSFEGDKNVTRTHRPAQALPQSSKISKVTKKNEDKENSFRSVVKSKRSQNNICNILMKSNAKALHVKDSSNTKKSSKEEAKKETKKVVAEKESQIENKAKALKVKNASNNQKFSKKQTKSPNVDKESLKKSSPRKELNCTLCDKKCNDLL